MVFNGGVVPAQRGTRSRPTGDMVAANGGIVGTGRRFCHPGADRPTSAARADAALVIASVASPAPSSHRRAARLGSGPTACND